MSGQFQNMNAVPSRIREVSVKASGFLSRKEEMQMIRQSFTNALVDWLDMKGNQYRSFGKQTILGQEVMQYLGNWNPHKQLMVKVLIASMTKNTKQFNGLHKAVINKKLAFQCTLLDPYDRSFAKQFISLLKKIGELN